MKEILNRMDNFDNIEMWQTKCIWNGRNGKQLNGDIVSRGERVWGSGFG